MSPDAGDLKNQIKLAEQQKHDAQRRIVEEKRSLRKQMADHDKHMQDIQKEKNKASADLSKLP